MSVTVDYLIVYSDEMDLIEFLSEMLKSALEAVGEGLLEAEEPMQYINIRYTKKLKDSHRICGFSVEFNSAEEWLGGLIDKFSRSVGNYTNTGVEHLLKLNDPQLRSTLHDYGDEIFKIEMKLREALSLIFVHTYGKDFYDLLKYTNVTTPEECKTNLMEGYYQNQFFFLQLNDYISINVGKQTNLERIVESIEQTNNFAELKQMITTKEPITKTRYVQFLTDLKRYVNRITDLRNCVAHNRSIPEQIKKRYEAAQESLSELIDEFLKEQANCETSDDTATGD